MTTGPTDQASTKGWTGQSLYGLVVVTGLSGQDTVMGVVITTVTMLGDTAAVIQKEAAT